MGTGGSPRGAAIWIGVPTGRASGRGAVVDFCWQEMSIWQIASRVRIKMALPERMKVLSGCKQADLCEYYDVAGLALRFTDCRTTKPSVKAAKE
jgi:hypothetical protein